MGEWFKVYGLGFFNDKLAARSEKYGFVSIVLTIVLSFVFFMFGFMAADVVPFSTHYDSASAYKEFLHNAVSESGLDIDINDGTAHCDDIVNTYTSESDSEKYSLNGYEFIIDTRASDTLIVFDQVAVNGDDEIDYEAYLLLSDKNKAQYRIETRYTDVALELTSDKIEKFEAYLDGITEEETDEYNSTAAEAYRKIKESDLSAAEYGKEIYYLYVRYYYTNIESSLMSAQAPVLCDYYYINYILKNNDKYICLLDDICAGSFTTDKNIPAMFAGYYRGCADGAITVDSVDKFVKDVYYSSIRYSMSSYFTGAMQLAPGYILIPIIVALILFLTNKATKRKFVDKFGGCYKVVNNLAWFSALLTALLTFILGFFVFSRKLYLFMPLIFAVILILRTAVFYITGSVEEKRVSEGADRSDNDMEQEIV